MIVVFEQVASLFIFIVIGYLLCACGIVKKEHSTLLSKLLVCIFLPANCIKTFSKNCTVDYIREGYSYAIISAIMLIIIVFVMHFAAKLFTRDLYDRNVYKYSLIFSNYGYMGYAMIESLLGPIELTNAMVFTLPMAAYVYSFGYCMLSEKKMTVKNLINPVTVSLAVGMILGLSGIGEHLPSLAYSALDKASACMAPVSMILAGMVISEFKITQILKDYRVYILSLLRLFVIPLAIGFSLYALGFGAEAKVAVLLYAMPCGLNTVVMPKYAGKNCETGASAALISNVLACISIPVVCEILNVYA